MQSSVVSTTTTTPVNDETTEQRQHEGMKKQLPQPVSVRVLFSSTSVGVERTCEHFGQPVWGGKLVSIANANVRAVEFCFSF